MTDFDDNLRNALNVDEESFLKNLEGDRGLFTQLGATFDGPMRFWTITVMVLAFVMTVLGLYAAWQLFQVETTRGLILWAVGVWAAFTMQIGLKQWLHNRMNHLGMLREIKRLELRIEQIAQKL